MIILGAGEPIIEHNQTGGRWLPSPMTGLLEHVSRDLTIVRDGQGDRGQLLAGYRKIRALQQLNHVGDLQRKRK